MTLHSTARKARESFLDSAQTLDHRKCRAWPLTHAGTLKCRENIFPTSLDFQEAAIRFMCLVCFFDVQHQTRRNGTGIYTSWLSTEGDPILAVI